MRTFGGLTFLDELGSSFQPNAHLITLCAWPLPIAILQINKRVSTRTVGPFITLKTKESVCADDWYRTCQCCWTWTQCITSVRHCDAVIRRTSTTLQCKDKFRQSVLNHRFDLGNLFSVFVVICSLVMEPPSISTSCSSRCMKRSDLGNST